MNELNSPQVTYRRATFRDVPALSAFISATWRHTYRDILAPRDLASSGAGASSWLSLALWARAQAHILVELACVENQIVGFMTAAREDKGRVVLYALYLAQEWQRRGMGTAFVERLQAHWPDTIEIRLEVLEANTQAIAFYSRLGFEAYGSTDNATGLRNVRSIYMDRRIAPPSNNAASSDASSSTGKA